MYRAVIFAVICGLATGAEKKCTPSVTTTSGSFAPTGTICPGDIIFQEEFDALNFQKWQHENTLGGGGVSISLVLCCSSINRIGFILCNFCQNFNLFQDIISTYAKNISAN